MRILDPDPARLEVRRNSEWLDMPMTELLALVRTTTVAQLLERDDFAKRWARAASRSRCSSCSTRCCRAMTRSRCDADIELGRHRPEVQPAARARHPARLRPARAGDPDDADPRRHRRARARCRSRWATRSASPTRRARLRQDDGDPRRGDGRVLPAAARPRAPPAGAGAARGQAGARARARLAGCTRRRPPSRPSASSTASSSSARRPARSTEARVRLRRTGACTCRRVIAERSASRARRRAA